MTIYAINTTCISKLDMYVVCFPRIRITLLLSVYGTLVYICYTFFKTHWLHRVVLSSTRTTNMYVCVQTLAQTSHACTDARTHAHLHFVLISLGLLQHCPPHTTTCMLPSLAHTHTHAHAHAHAHTHTHTHTHTHNLLPAFLLAGYCGRPRRGKAGVIPLLLAVWSLGAANIFRWMSPDHTIERDIPQTKAVIPGIYDCSLTHK